MNNKRTDNSDLRALLELATKHAQNTQEFHRQQLADDLRFYKIAIVLFILSILIGFGLSMYNHGKLDSAINWIKAFF